MEREPTTDDCKCQGTQMNLDSYSRINDLNRWNGIRWKDGIKEFLINQHEVLYNVEELNEQNVHEIVTVQRMANMQSQDN